MTGACPRRKGFRYRAGKALIGDKINQWQKENGLGRGEKKGKKEGTSPVSDGQDGVRRSPSTGGGKDRGTTCSTQNGKP